MANGIRRRIHKLPVTGKSNSVTPSQGMKACSICGKPYIQAPGNIYRVPFAGRSNSCCSYTCYMIAKRTKKQEDISESQYRKY